MICLSRFGRFREGGGRRGGEGASGWDWNGLCCNDFSPSVSQTCAYASIFLVLHSITIPYSWLTGGTTIGSGLAYLQGGGTGQLLLKNLRLKEGETATADSADGKDSREKEKKVDEEK